MPYDSQNQQQLYRNSVFRIRYSPRSGFLLVPAAAPSGPADINQVFVRVFDATNNALRINGMLSPGGAHTPNDANQVSLSVFDPTNNALRVNCVLGCGGGGGAPGGSSTQVQFNNNNALGGSPNLTWSSPALTIGANASATGQLLLANGGGGGASVALQNNGATTAYNFNLPVSAGASGQCLQSGGGGSNPNTWGPCGTGSPGGTNTAVQYNSSSSFGGDASNFFYNSTTHALTATGALTGASFTVGTGANNTSIANGTLTAARTFTLPDANSNPVQPSSAPANQFATGISSAGVVSYGPAVTASTAPSNQFANGISAAGAVSYAQPAFSNLNGNATIAQGGTNATSSTAGTVPNATSSSASSWTASPTLGLNASTTGQLGLANGGASGATVTVQNNAATTAYNFNLPATAGTSGQCLQSGGGGSAPNTWGGCGTGSPGGANTAVQYNGSGSFGGDASNFFYNSTTHALTATGAVTGASFTVGTGANNTSIANSTLTAARTFALPDANSNPVQPSNAPANTFATGISSVGVISYGAAVSASTAPSHQFANAFSAAGALTYAQPSFADIGTGTIAVTGTVGTGGSLTTSGSGTINANQYKGGTASGTGMCGVNAFASTLNDAAAPTCTAAVSASTAPSNQFAKGISAAGALSYAQPAFSNLSGNATIAQGGTNATSATAGTLPNATSSSASSWTASPTLGLNASTTGQLGLANGGASGATVTVQNNAATTAYNFNLPATAGTSGQCLQSGGGGGAPNTWGTCGGGAPGGSSTQVQFNSSNAFGGSPNLTWSSPALTIGANAGATGQLLLANGGTGGASVALQNNGATSAYNFNLPVSAGTSGQCLQSGGGGSAPNTWGNCGGAGAPGGSNTAVQFNSGGSAFGGNSNFTTDGSGNATLAGTVTAAGFVGSGNGQACIKLPSVASGTGYVQACAPSTSFNNAYTFLLPTADGVANQPVVTNGSGTWGFGTTLALGVNSTTTGQLLLANGGASGTSVTLQNNAATSAYNFNLPATAGTSGQCLQSGGGSAAMTWGSCGGGGGMGDPGANGIVVRTALNTTVARTLTAGSVKISVTNGDGVSGNPTVNLGTVASSDLSDGASLEKTTNKGAANGYAGLDAGAKLPLSVTPLTTSQDILYDNAGALARLPITTVTSGQCLGNNAGTWGSFACSGGGGGSPQGPSGAVQYNNGGAFGGTSSFTTDGTGNVTLAGTVTAIGFAGSGTGQACVKLPSVASGTGYVQPCAPAASFNDMYTFVLPTVDGTANQAVVTNGTATWSFASLGSLAGSLALAQTPLTTSQDILYDNAGALARLPISTVTSGQCLGNNAGTWGSFSCGGGGGAVSSVFGRTGDVVATAGDYTLDEIGNMAASTTNTFASGTTLTLNGSNATPFIINESAGSSDIADFQFGGVNKFQIGSNGSITANSMTLNASGAYLASQGSSGSLTLRGQDLSIATSATVTLRGGNISGSTASLTGQAVTVNGGDNSSTGATNNGGAVTLRGGDATSATAVADVGGSVTIRGGNSAGTASGSTGGNVTIQGGSNGQTSANATYGRVIQLQPFFTTGTATQYSLACVTATNTVATCTTAANNANAIGWIYSVSGSTAYVQTAVGQVVTGLATSAAFTAGQWACADTSTTAGYVVPSGTKCTAGLPGGVVLTTATTTNPVFISIAN